MLQNTLTILAQEESFKSPSATELVANILIWGNNYTSVSRHFKYAFLYHWCHILNQKITVFNPKNATPGQLNHTNVPSHNFGTC
jgi:hypothetical protein